MVTFLHRGVFKIALLKGWHVDRDTRVLRHMTRGRVLYVDTELYDGQRLQVFNVHQATSGDLPLQQYTLQVLTKSVMECLHQRILLGGDLNASANGTRVGYAVSKTEHLKRVNELLTNFVSDTKRCLMSPSMVPWRRGSKEEPSSIMSSRGTFPLRVTRGFWGRAGGMLG